MYHTEVPDEEWDAVKAKEEFTERLKDEIALWAAPLNAAARVERALEAGEQPDEKDLLLLARAARAYEREREDR